MKIAIVILACLALSACDEAKSGKPRVTNWQIVEKNIDCNWSARLASCLCVFRDRRVMHDVDAAGVTIVPAKVCGK